MILAAEQLDATGTVILTFIGAAFGSACAVALEAYLTRRGSKQHFMALLRGLDAEIDEIEGRSSERTSRGAADLRLDPPYPEAVWRELSRLPESRRLGDSYRPISTLYGAVEDANHQTMQVATLVQIASMAPSDEVRLAFRDMAHTFSAGSQQAVVERVGPARAAINGILERTTS